MKVMMITGAGISTGSGLSTYRGADGRYTHIEQEFGMPVERLLSLNTLQERPELIWKYWLRFTLALKTAEPSPTHLAIKRIADQCESFLEATQNVDGLSRLAGLDNGQLIELHGTYHRHYCMHCKAQHQLGLHEEVSIPPKCFRCGQPEGAVIRPDVVMFNELLKDDHLERSVLAAASCDLLIVTGTSLQFPYLWNFMINALVNNREVMYIDPHADAENLVFHLFPPSLRAQERIHFLPTTSDVVLPKLAEALSHLQDAAGVVKWARQFK
jgi:NAD-dependent deacetylase